MRIVIHGAGSIGCYVGGKLAASGEEVVFYGRERIAAPIRQNGLTLSHFEDDEIRLAPGKVLFETSPACLANADLILLCVKSQHTLSAASEIATHADQHATIVSLQNGVTNVETLKGALPDHKIIGGMVPYNVVNLGEGRFHCGVEGQLVFDNHPETQNLAGRLRAAHLPTELTSDIDSIMWGKLIMNLNNALNMLSGKPLLQQLSDRDYRLVLAMCVTETLDVLKAADIKPAKIGKIGPGLFPILMQLPNWLYGLIMKGAIKIDDEARSSMWEDLQAGRTSEVDYINGAVVALGAKVGVETPVNTRIIELVNQAFAEGKSPAFAGPLLLGLVTQ